MDIGDVGSALLEPFQRALSLGSELIDTVGEGVEWTGEQIEELAALVARLAAKVEGLQAAAKEAGDAGS